MESQLSIALISFGSSIIALLGNYVVTSKKEAVKNQLQTDQINGIKEDLKRVDKKLEEHNNLNDKIRDLSVSYVSMSKDVEYIKERLKNG